MTTSAATFAKSLWVADCDEPAPAADTPRDADLVVIGGGFTGLSAALHMARAGHSVTLFEAQEVGYGASGRNGGQVIPGFKYDPGAIVAKYGPEAGEAMVQFGASAPDLVFDLVDTYAIACKPERRGWIQAAHSQTALRAVEDRAAQWAARGVRSRVLDRADMEALVGTASYSGGWLDPRAGIVQPLAYARGLARAARSAGTRIVPQTPVTALAQNSGSWTVTTRHGTTRAGCVLVATGAYGDDRLVPGLARSILPAQSNIIATAPLPEEVSRTVLPFGGALSEIRKLAFYVRKTYDNRLVLGGRGAIGEAHSIRLQKALERAMVRMFPQLAAYPPAHAWSGQVGLTMDGWPHLHQTKPGLFAALGFNGRGVAMATATGKMIAGYMANGSPMALPLSEVRPVRWHGMRGPVMRTGIGYYWIKDAMGLPG